MYSKNKIISIGGGCGKCIARGYNENRTSVDNKFLNDSEHENNRLKEYMKEAETIITPPPGAENNRNISDTIESLQFQITLQDDDVVGKFNSILGDNIRFPLIIRDENNNLIEQVGKETVITSDNLRTIIEYWKMVEDGRENDLESYQLLIDISQKMNIYQYTPETSF